MVPINVFAVLVSAAIAFVLGGLWYGPLFGRAWMKTLGMNMDEMKAKAQSDPSMKAKMTKGYALTAVGSLFMATALAYLLIFTQSVLHLEPVMLALKVSFIVWLGFVAPVTITGVLWENKPWKWWYITAGYYLVSLTVMGLVLALWQ